MGRDTPLIKDAPRAHAVGLMKYLLGDRARGALCHLISICYLS